MHSSLSAGMQPCVNTRCKSTPKTCAAPKAYVDLKIKTFCVKYQRMPSVSLMCEI